MVQQVVNIGASAGDGAGDPLRAAFTKINQNFTELYGRGAAGANFDLTDNRIIAVNTNGNIELYPNGTGRVIANSDVVTSGKFVGDGGLLTNIAATSGTYINNGTSNVVVQPSGNVNISSAGNANIFVVTGSGANIAGTFNATGNANVGNLDTGTVIATTANLTTINSGLLKNGTSNVSITNNSNVSVFVAGNATACAVFTSTGANIAGTANISNDTDIGGNITVTGTANISNNTSIGGNLTVVGNLTVQGVTTTIGSENYSVTDSIINLHTFANLAPLTADDGRDIGIKMHYFKSATDKHAFVGWANDTGFLEYYSDATESAGVISGTYGTIKVANVLATDGVFYNGTSNVTVNNNGNVNISVGGNIVTVTSTGANISGTLDVSGNANVGNLDTAQVLASANITSPQIISNIATGTAPIVVSSTTQVANLNAQYSGNSVTANTVVDANQPNITSVGTLTNVTVAAGNTSVAPINLTSGTNLTSATAGAFEYDGTTLNFTPSTNYGRSAIPTTIYTSGQGTSLTASSEATAQALFPAGNDTITLPVGTYFITLNASIQRGSTSTTTATARINLGGGGTAVGTFSGTAVSSIAAGGASNLFVFSGAALTVDNVVTATNAAAAGFYNIHLSGILRITTAGTFIPKYNLSVNIGAGTATAPNALNHLVIQSMASSGSVAATGSWA